MTETDIDPHEGAEQPEPLPFDWRTYQPPIDPCYRRRRTFQCCFFRATGTEDYPYEERTPDMTARQARAFLENQLTMLRTKHQRFRKHDEKVCWFDPLPVDPCTGLPPGEREQS